MTDQELELELNEAGTRLGDPPSSVDDLLGILDKLESCLTKVEQSPSESMRNAMEPSLKALASEKIREHSDVDVKVAAASCVSEITRITAPDAPFEDEQMREFFKLIVAAFEKLDDTSSRSYSKRVSILETLAKVRSCVVMLDLECDTLINQMFQHFLNSIRESHEDAVLSSMETVMSLVLEESEEVNPDLISLLLDCVKKDNQDILPVARGLAEKVFSACAAKLKPCLLQSLESMKLSLNDYSEIVATICQETHDADGEKPNDGNSSGEHVVKELEPQSTCTHEIDPVGKQSPKSVMSNGNAPIENDNALMGVNSSKEEAELSDTAIQSAEGGEANNLENQLAKSETKSDQSTKKKRGRKPKSLKKTAGVSDHSHIDGDEESSDVPDGQTDPSKVINSPHGEDQSGGGANKPPEDEKESQPLSGSPTVPLDQNAKVSSPNSQNTPEGSRPKRGRPPRVKKESTNEETGSGLHSNMKSNEKTEAGESKSSDAILKEEKVDMGAKSNQRSGRKPSSRDKDDDLVLPRSDAKIDSGVASDLEDKPKKRSGKKVDAKESNENKLPGKKEVGKMKKGRTASSSEKDAADDTIIKGKLSSQKAKSKSVDKNPSKIEETPQTGFKRKRTLSKEENSVEEFGENLVGRKIEVLWPDDKEFYAGYIISFDPDNKKHKVVYVDGDEEVLVLSNEKWKFVCDEKEETDVQSPSSPETPRKKKVKTSSDSLTKQSKGDTKGKGASSSKPKGRPPGKSGGKSKDDSSPGTKSIDETPKTASKSKSGSGRGKSKSISKPSKSKDDSPKTGGKSKDDTDTPKTGAKLKDNKKKAGSSSSKSPKPGTKTKASANGTSAKGKSSASKVEESEEPKGSAKGRKRESEDSTKGKGSDSGDGKSGKKRRKNAT
ncbi:hypothetical protein Scep_023686 [Stephania cephalantha]|uniref:Tudor domain-containing protein n=1 Tax=Stephania cephalantha TaxID=152367 RepID=A0AAP0EW55_9MAGN